MIWPSCSLRISNIHASFSCVLFSQITHGTQSGFQFHEFHEDKPSDQLWRGNHRSLTPVLLRRSRCKSNSTLFRFSWMRDFGDPPTALPKRGMDRTINVVCRVLSKAGRSDDSPSWCEDQNFMEPMNWACSYELGLFTRDVVTRGMLQAKRIFHVSRKRESHSLGKGFSRFNIFP